jgi:hypothetical protein
MLKHLQTKTLMNRTNDFRRVVLEKENAIPLAKRRATPKNIDSQVAFGKEYVSEAYIIVWDTVLNNFC